MGSRPKGGMYMLERWLVLGTITVVMALALLLVAVVLTGPDTHGHLL